jgi:hypothetical protein
MPAVLATGIALADAAGAQPPACPPGDAWPARMRLEYDVTASRGVLAVDGESVLVFERDGGGYRLSVDTKSPGLYSAQQTSRGTIETRTLRPVQYVERRGRRDPVTTSMDWDAQRVTFSAAPDALVTTRPGLQDRATLLLQLAWLQRAAPQAASLEVAVAGSRRTSVYRFVRKGRENLDLPAGAIEAARLDRADDERDRIEAWFGTGWCGLPVRVRYIDHKGGVIEHRLRAARLD